MSRLVMIFGTFDIIHPGHIHFFKQAQKHGQRIVAVIARDMTTQKVKGKLPVNSEGDRKELVETVSIIDKVVFGDKKDQMKIIRRFRPDAICLGYDQTAFVEKLKVTFPDLKIIRLKAYKPEYYKSSKLK